MTEPTPPAPKKRAKPGPKPRKGTDAALALRVLYEESDKDERALIRNVVADLGCSAAFLREIADQVEHLDEEGYDLAADLFDVVDKRTGA